MPHSLPLRAAVMALTLAALAACTQPPPPTEPIRAVRTRVVQLESAGGALEFAAEVRARTESRLGFRVGGKLAKRLVNVGDTVRAGQVLALLDPQDLRLAQQAAQAALRSTQSAFDLSQAEFSRYKELREQNFIGSLELERREAALKAARAQLEQAKSQVDLQGNQASYSTLVADVAGVVTAVDAEPGAVLAAGTPVLRLAQAGARDVQFAVAENQVGALRALAGQAGALQVRLWGQPQESRATVREVAAAADATTRTFAIKAELADPNARLGQTATVHWQAPQREGVIKLPLPAVAQVQGATVVWLLDKASLTVKPQTVKVGAADANQLEITSGLKAGDTVVTAGVHTLTPGQKVKLYIEPGASAPTVAQR
ncbi:RND family efflux transporter, MFP subunit [Burkholderiales bacterium JOSHI_001]|nr:RND family efflux transporter, MFP subunit [Burkholderiales bacterium JOSHI_001]